MYLGLSELSQQLSYGFFGAHIHATLRTNCIHFSSTLTAYLVPPSALNFNLSSALIYR